MLFLLKDIQDYTLRAQEGDLGKIQSFIIDDNEWVVRYLVVEAGDRSFLLSVTALGQPDPQEQVLPVRLSTERLNNSPEINLSQPLTRELERQLYDYYEWPYYWDADSVPNTMPGDLTSVPLIEMELEREEREDELIPETGSADFDAAGTGSNFHLRVTREIIGYTIHATNDDNNAGKLEDMLIQSQDWNILYLVVGSGGLMSSNRVLLSPSWVQQIDEMDSRIDVDLKEETIRQSPPFRSVEELTPEYQTRLNDYYRH